MHDTWAARDLPVLDATIGLLEHSYMVTVTDIADKTGFDPSVVAQALDALDPVYVDFRKTTTGGDPRFWYVFKVTPEARRAVGQWPTAEALISRLAEELSTAARRETDAEHQGLLTYAARLIGDTLYDAAVRAAGALLAPPFGGLPAPELGQQLPSAEPPQPQAEFRSLVPLPELPELLRSTPQPAAPEPAAFEPPPAPPAPERPAAAPEQPATAPPAPQLAATALLAAEPVAPVPDSAATVPPAPQPTVTAPYAPEPAATAPEPPATAPESAAGAPLTPEPATAEPPTPQSATAEPPGWFEPRAVEPTEPSADVPDMNPWPELPNGSATWPSTPNLAPAERPDTTDPAAPAAPAEPEQPEPTPFRSSFGTWPAADADVDAADTDLDMVQARRDAV